MKNKNKQVIILRGVSGAGKSTFVKKNYPNAEVVSADFYFTKNGEYKFDPKQLTSAHKECFGQFEFLLENGAKLIVVDNTNTRLWEFDRYIGLTEEYGYQVNVIRLNPNWEIAADRNTHGVLKNNVQAMNDRMEPYEGEKVLTNY